MNSAALGPLFGQFTNHLWQSTVFALAAALLTLAFRKNRAHVRYWIWLSATVKFLVPFALLISLGSTTWNALAARKITNAIATPSVSATVAQIAQPFSETQSFASATNATTHSTDWPLIIAAALWACGFFAVALMRLRAWQRIRTALKSSEPIDISSQQLIASHQFIASPQFIASQKLIDRHSEGREAARRIPLRLSLRATPGLLEPGVVGIFRQTLLLPEGILQNLTPRQMESVLAHELSHIRRRDNLTAAIHMLVEALFWFHPLVWWIGARLVEERERACDESVLSRGNQPRDYAEAILGVCKLYLESPLACVSGVTGADLKNRIHEILSGRVSDELKPAKKAALAVAAAAALALPILMGAMALPSLRAQSAIGLVPKWDVISIKPCSADSAGGFQPNGAPNAGFSPMRMTLNCQPVIRFIQNAYLLFPDAQAPPNRNFAMLTPIEGAPDWVKKERYMIEANSSDNATPEMMEGPMLQALLEDKFKLKLHHETRQVPVYDLVIAKGGPKLAPFVEGSCVPWQPPDIVTGPPTPRPQLPAGQKYCLRAGGTGNASGTFLTNLVLDDDGTTLDSLCKDLFNSVGSEGRRVINKTGLTGRYSIHLEYSISEASRNELTERGIATADPTFPEIFTAVQEQLGLQLVPDKGPGDFVVIDHIEQPPAN